MVGGIIGLYLSPRRVLRYVLENPGTALKIAAAGLVVLAVTVLSVAVDAIPVWVAGYVLAAVVFLFAYLQVRQVMLLRAASEDDAGALTPGPTKVHGTVVQATDHLVETPSGTECVAYEYERVREQGHGEDRHRQRHTERDAVPFHVEDGSGRALVSPSGARLELKHDEGSRLPLLADRATEESYLEPGDSVNVYGEGVRPDVAYDGSGVADADGPADSGERAGGDGQPATTPESQPVSPFEGMDVPAEALPEGVDSPEELIDPEDVQPPEDMPPQYREYYREQMEEGGVPGVTGASPGSGPDGESGGVLRGVAEAAAEMPGRYDHLLGREDLVVGSGPEYGSVLITDKGGFRVFGKQLLLALGMVGVGLAILAGSAAATVGLVQLG